MVLKSAEYLHYGYYMGICTTMGSANRYEYKYIIIWKNWLYMIRCQEKDTYASTNLSSLFKKKKPPNQQNYSTPNREQKTSYLATVKPKILMHIPVNV